MTALRSLATAALAAAALVFAPTAGATPEDQYLNSLHAQGFSSPQGDQSLLNWGHQVCSERKAGWTNDRIAKDMDAKTSIDYDSSMMVVRTAIQYLC